MSIRLPAAEKLAKQLLELRPPRMEALEPRFFTAMAKVIMAYVDIDEQRQRTEKIMEQPPTAAKEPLGKNEPAIREALDAIGTPEAQRKIHGGG
jgi:hypothetical protein